MGTFSNFGGQPRPNANCLGRRITAWGLEPGAAQRMNPSGRITKEIAPTLRQNMGDNQASVIITDEEETLCICGTPSPRLKRADH